MRNIVGQAVSGSDFFNRNKDIQDIYKVIHSGNDILISAPRRVGKTSILYYLKDNPTPNCHFIYVITEAADNENEFFKRIYNQIVETNLAGRFKKIGRYKSKVSGKIKGLRTPVIGVNFNKREDSYYQEKLIKLLKSIEKNNRIVIMIDEFPQTLENIIQNQDTNKAIRFLQINRELRQSRDLENVQFIYTGSIGLENIVSRLNAMNLISDLNILEVKPLSIEEAESLVQSILESLNFNMTKNQIEYMLSKIENFVPFYIQMLISEINNLYINKELQLTDSIIDTAFNKMLERRNYFEHWHSRLKKAFKDKEYVFTQQVLNSMSDKPNISSNEIFDLAVKHEAEAVYKEIIKALIHDGYINNNEPELYSFNSPILKTWWYENVKSYSC